MTKTLVLGTRGSALALAQANIVLDALRQVDPTLSVRIEKIVTTGDARSDVPLAQLGRGIFTSDIDAALLAGTIDVAVHSAKDLPSTTTDGLTIAAFLEREDPRDVLVSREGKNLSELPAGSRVGTSSPRRACLVRSLRPDLDVRDVRGNVDTRLRKLAAGEYDALILAAAGLLRLGRGKDIVEWLDPAIFVPSVGQGALAIEVRSDDHARMSLVQRLDHGPTRASVTAERAFLAELGAGCRAAAAACAHHRQDGALHFVAAIGNPNGSVMRREFSGAPHGATQNAIALAREMILAGAAIHLAPSSQSLAGLRVASTRPERQSETIAALIAARGGIPLCFPAIAVEPVQDTSELDAAIRAIDRYDWIVFTSANAVHPFADRLHALNIALPHNTRLAAVGGATAHAISERLRAPVFVPSTASAAALANQLPDATGARVLFVAGRLAGTDLVAGIAVRQGDVDRVDVYDTVAGTGLPALIASIQSGQTDIVLFTSPSAVRHVGAALAKHRMPAARLPRAVCVGSATADALRRLGVTPAAIATSQSSGGIVEALERLDQ